MSNTGGFGGTGGGRGQGQGGSGRGMGQGGRGRGGGRGLGPGGQCVCPSCGATAPHQQGTPCNSVKCPKCGQIMARG
jgi:hypothetical protein